MRESDRRRFQIPQDSRSHGRLRANRCVAGPVRGQPHPSSAPKHLSRVCACAAGGAAPSAATRFAVWLAMTTEWPYSQGAPGLHIACVRIATRAGGRERGAPLRAAGPSHVTSVFRPEHEVGLSADRTRGESGSAEEGYSTYRYSPGCGRFVRTAVSRIATTAREISSAAACVKRARCPPSISRGVRCFQFT